MSIAVLAFAVIFSVGCGLYHRTQPAYVVKVLNGINTKADVERGEEYFTPQGRDVIK